MGGWSFSPPPNVPGNTADSGQRCIGNEGAESRMCVSPSQKCLCVVTLWSKLGPSQICLLVPCYSLENYEA